MKQFNLSAQDRNWLSTWMRNNLVCAVGVACLLVGLQMGSTVPLVQMKQASADPIATATDGISVPPHGWRRTINGWEHVSAWRSPSSRPLGEIVSIQRQREPAWLQQSLRRLRELPPLIFALFQLTAIAAIIWVADAHKKTRPEISNRV
jgi:hypothetical protein